jgi:hydrogenase maturation protease
MEEVPRILILGIGNLLWADEGFGVRAVEALHRSYAFPANVTLIDGGTQGIYLIEYVRNADILVVFDAVDYALPPGTIKLVEDGEVPKFLGAKKMSLHQTGFQEVLAMADMLGDLPRHLFLIGVQPVELDDYGGSLRNDVKAQIAPAIGHAIAYLARFGIEPERRATPLSDDVTLSSSEVALSLYESGRPSEAEACRHGDPRVLGAAGNDKGSADAPVSQSMPEVV